MTQVQAPVRRGSAAALAALRRPASDQVLFLVASLAILVLIAGRASGLKGVPEVENFAIVLASIVIEALPFVLLGALVASLIEVYVPDRTFSRVAGLPMHLQVPTALLASFSFPVCECGSVPVARRLMLRGVHPAAGITFMLAAPILNPVVLASTWVAYSGRDALEMTLARAGLGAVVALVVAVMIGNDGASKLLRLRPTDSGHSHGRGGGRARALVDHTAGDVFFMGKFLVAGAALAAALQTAIPQSVFAGVLAVPLVSALLMMLLAVLLSLCSEADAFVAVSFVQFPLGSQLAFLVFGPVFDLKLGLLYGATFGWRFVGWLLFVTVPLVLAGSLFLNALVLT